MFTFNDLLSLILQPYISDVLENGGYKYNYNGKHHWFIVEGYGKIICRSLNDPARIVGYQTFRAHADEVDTIKQEKIDLSWKRLIARNRQKVYELNDNGSRIQVRDENGELSFDVLDKPEWKMYENRVSAYTTPEGWAFAYKQWVEEGSDNPDYEYVQASTYSNAHNLPKGYIDRLKRSYPPELVEAYIDGQFTNLTKGRLYKNFDRRLNGSKETVQEDDILLIGFDFNIEHCTAAVMVQRKDEETGEITDHVVDEVVDAYDTDEVIEILNSRYPKNRKLAFPDASGTKRSSGATNITNTKGQATQTDLFKLKRHFELQIDYGAANPGVKDRVINLHGRILNGKLKRRLFVNVKKCPNVVKTLEQQVWENGIPDKSKGLDHLGDCLGYIMFKVYPPVKSGAGFGIN